SDAAWRVLVAFEEQTAVLGRGLGLVAQALGVSVDQLMLPPSFLDPVGFHLSTLELTVAPPTGQQSTTTLIDVAVTLGSTKEWNPPIPFVRIRNVGMRWVVSWAPIDGQDTLVVSGSVYGAVVIGDDP